MSGQTSRAGLGPVSPVAADRMVPSLLEIVLQHLPRIGLVVDDEHSNHVPAESGATATSWRRHRNVHVTQPTAV